LEDEQEEQGAPGYIFFKIQAHNLENVK